MNNQDHTRPLVYIRCITYNQADYIRYALEGFVMQQTNFRFEAVVHDDASTDGTADIVREYAEKYPDIIKPIIETENQHSKGDGSLNRIMDEATRGAKYVSLCEGDDYWIDPLKLQKQVDFLERHPDYSMCWTDAFVESAGKQTPYRRYPESCQSPVEDIIEQGGAFIPTCSIVVRNEVLQQMPLEARNFYVGDYPLQMWAAFSGKCHYMKEQTCVYRYGAKGSWTAKAWRETRAQRLLHVENEKKLLAAFNRLSNYQYKDSFERAEATSLIWQLCLSGEYEMARPYLQVHRKYGIPVSLSKADILRIEGHPLLAWITDRLSKIKNLR